MASIGLGELLIVTLICGLWIVPVLGTIALVIWRGRRTRERD